MRFIRKSRKLTAMRSAAPIVMAVTLSACAVLVPPPAPAVYDLTIGDAVTVASGSTNSQILITEPKVINSLDNQRIAIKPSPSKISFFGDVEWSDRVPRLVQLYLSRAFSETGKTRAVGLPGDGLIIDHQLLFDLKAFQIEVGSGQTTADVEIAVRILNDKNGRVVAKRIFRASVPAKDDVVSAVASLNKALDQATAEIISWVFDRI